jgi:hypothetical protein
LTYPKQKGSFTSMNEPSQGLTYTVEADSYPGTVEPHEIEVSLSRLPDYLSRYGFRDAAVSINGEHAVSVTAQVTSPEGSSPAAALREALPWIRWFRLSYKLEAA